MSHIKELALAPIQGNGPAWEEKSLCDNVVEDRAVAGCQGSAEFSDENAKRLPPGGGASRDPTSSTERREESPSVNNTSICLVDQNDGDNGATTLPAPPETRCVAEADDPTAAAQSTEEETATPCGGLEHTDDDDVEKSISPGHATPEQKGPDSFDGFQELLQAAMRQSDAERAHDRESARNFRRIRQPSPLGQKHRPVDRPIISTPTETQRPPTTRSSASDRSGAECIPADSARTANDVAVDSTNSSSSSPALVHTPEPDALKPVVVERQWVRYLSPDGYPYLYDEMTGESEWVGFDEEEAQAPQNEEPIRDATSNAMHAEPGTTGRVLDEQDGHKDLVAPACTETGEKNTLVYPAEGESVGTCEVSQWSQDTSGPDARNSAGETAMHLAAAQCSPRGISLLLANGASVNARDNWGRTPLHATCASCHNKKSRGGGDADIALLECVELLLSSGALEDARDAKGQTALHLAALASNLSAVRALLAAGASAVADDAGNSPLHLAAAQGHSDIIQLLVVGNHREEPPRKTPALAFSEVDTRAECRPPAAVAGLQPVFDVDLSAHERGRGTVSVGRQESTPTITNGKIVCDDGLAARTATTAVQHRGVRDNVPRKPTAGTISSREEYSPYGVPGVSSLKDGPPLSVDNGHSWGESPSLNSVPNDQNDPLGQRGVHESARSLWQGQADSLNGLAGNSTRNAGRLSEDDAAGSRGDGVVEAEHRRRRPKGSKLSSRRRHEVARDDRTLCWPEALSSTEYDQVVGAAFAGEGDSGSRAPSRSALSAALFAACLASLSSDAAAVLHLLGMHGEGIRGVRDENGRTPLHHVCRADDVGLVRLLCQAGADAAAQDRRGNSPLMVAAATGSLSCLKLLVQQGSDLNCSNDDGDTPLHLAVRHGNLSCVKTLVERGAWLSQRNTQGFTPREDLLNTKPMFTRGRLPKVLRTTLEYIGLAEASAAQPNSPSWTARDGYGSETTAASAVSCQSLTDNPHHRRDSFGQPSSSRRGGQQLTADRGMALPGQPRRVQGSTPTSITERREREKEWEPRESQGGGDVFDGQSEGGHSSGGDRRGWRNRREQTERRQVNSACTDIGSKEDSEEEPPEDSGGPSRLRTGVWSVVGRAIDSLIGGGNGSSDGAPDRSGSVVENDDPVDHRRPPTDAELRARMTTTGSPSSKSGFKHTSGAGSYVEATYASQAGRAPESEPPSPSTTEQVAVNVPISLTPMQPPPDVLAAMKGRAALGCRRPRFSAPPEDVAAALDKTGVAKNHGHANVVGHGAVRGKDGNGGTKYISYPDRQTDNQRPRQQHDTRQELGPFSLSASGGLGKQGDRSAHLMFKRAHGTGADDV